MPIYPGATYRQVTDHDGGPHKGQWLGAVLHVQAGYGSCFDIFQQSRRPNRKSAHFWIPKANAAVEQYLDTNLISWAQGDGNPDYISIETEGQPTEPLTAYQIGALAALYLWLHETHDIPFHLAEKPGDRGLGWHGMGGSAFGDHPHCPGDLRKAQRQHILDLAQCAVPSQPTPPVVINFPEENVRKIQFRTAPLGSDGNGWHALDGVAFPDVPADKFLSATPIGSAPDRDHVWWKIPKIGVNAKDGKTLLTFVDGEPGQAFDIIVVAAG